MVKNILLNSGISEKEADVYLALFQFGSASAPQLARYLTIPRQTVYSILQNLISLKLVDQGKRDVVNFFYTDSEKLLFYVNRKKQQAAEDVSLLEKELPQLLQSRKKNPLLPRIQYYEGSEGLIRLFNNILDVYEKGKSKKFRGYGINKFQGVLNDYLYSFVKKRAELGVVTNLFVGKGPDDFGITDDQNLYNRNIKRLNIEPQNAALYIVANKIYLFSYKDSVGIMIENQEMASLLKNVFDDHWGKYK